MKLVTVTFDEGCVAVPIGCSILEAERRAGLWPDSPCGGRGTCGKCKVEVLTQDGPKQVLACRTPVADGMQVRLPTPPAKQKILHAGQERQVPFSPLVQTKPIPLDQVRHGRGALWSELCKAAGVRDAVPVFDQLDVLWTAVRQGATQVWAILWADTIIALTLEQPGCYLMAADIGTTTLVGYLLDGESGKQLAYASMENPQASYGADVVTRAARALEAAAPLQSAVRSGLAQIMEAAAKQADISPTDILLTVLVGNTCMHHLFIGLPTDWLVAAPYRPALCAPVELSGLESGLPMNPLGRAVMLPNIAGFVGADTVGCMLSAEFDRLPCLTLLVDLGTNGELMLGDGTHSLACATAAGPAFEGCGISCGMRGETGAVDHVFLDEAGEVSCHVLGSTKARGLCGSGLLDAVAVLLRAGVISCSGRMARSEELKGRHKDRIVMAQNNPSYLLVSEAETESGEGVLLTQADVRQFQLAKGAIAAGIALLTQEWGATLQDIGQVLVAGAFGSYMDPDSACETGLLPPELRGKITAVGNAAGAGARLVARSSLEYARCLQIADKAAYLELATHPEFQDTYVEALTFGDDEPWFK